ncbi:MAG: hypothetical protein CVT49_09185 [candidate division Zixibacteria bacterium HGW-Zixibacteria-1]|nr:MAG: hypothetical protein CVT49_09185 [candidate division Zixibacteria bacterium HGW-Zixibacteria-1]
MRKLLLLSFLVFILVAINWFKPGFCQTLSDQELLEKYREFGQQKGAADNSYTTPEIFGDQPTSAGPADSSSEFISGDLPEMKEALGAKDKELKPFGNDLFLTPSELSPPSEVADLSEYILGPGDNIIIYLWGKVEKEYNLTVDRQGKVFIPKVGEVVVWGQAMSEFENNVTKKLQNVYTDFKVSVSLGKIRSIRVYLTGEVKKPGAYTVSSLTTLFNALYLAGGPNERGSMRNIQLIRNNRIESRLDLYQFLIKGDSRCDVRLASGDAIFIPVSGPRVSIDGEVKRPAIYELIGGEKVGSLLELAGGPTAEAYLDRIMLDRISPEDERQVIDLNMNQNNGNIDDMELADGDVLTVFSVYDMKQNIVSIAGMVKHPGQFERTDSTTLKTLVDRGELLPQDVFLGRANLFRRYPDRRIDIIPVDLNEVMAGRYDLALHDLDSLHIYSIDEVKRREYVYIDGEIKRPGKFLLYDNMTVSDLIFLAGDFNKNAYQLGLEVARTDSLGRVSLLNIDLSDSASHSFALHEDDRVFVRKLPDWFMHRIVTIEGEVQFPGQYALRSKNETLYELIQRAGGFTDNAFPGGTIFKRQSIAENLERQNVPAIIANSQPLKEDSLGNIRKINLVDFNPDGVNRIIIDMDKLFATGGSEGNIKLQRNDYIYIPESPTGISVMGAVGSNGTIRYLPGKNVKYYVERAGNFTNQAYKKGTQLIKADGQVFAKGGTLKKKVELGDVIVVPTEIKKDRDWLKAASSTISIIGGIVTSAFVISRL